MCVNVHRKVHRLKHFDSGLQARYDGGLDFGDKWDSSFDSYERNTRSDSLFSDPGTHNVISKPLASPPPGFAHAAHRGSNSYLSHDFGNANIPPLDSIDHRTIGESMVRSHSAAPSLDARLPFEPPGLATSETPQMSNRGPGESYLGPSIDRASILQVGQRRPASTGVIGASQNLSPSVLASLGLSPGNPGAVRPSAKSLMDLIQEDFPPDSPFDARQFGSQYSPRSDFMVERPRTTSPPSQNTRDFMYDNSIPRGDIRGLDGTLDHRFNGSFDGFGAQVSSVVDIFSSLELYS